MTAVEHILDEMRASGPVTRSQLNYALKKQMRGVTDTNVEEILNEAIKTAGKKHFLEVDVDSEENTIYYDITGGGINYMEFLKL